MRGYNDGPNHPPPAPPEKEKVMEPLTGCTHVEGQLKQLRIALYEDDYERALDISTEVIKSAMQIRDQLWRMSYVSGDPHAGERG